MKTITITMSDDLQQRLFDFLISSDLVKEVGEAVGCPVIFTFGTDCDNIDIKKLEG